MSWFDEQIRHRESQDTEQFEDSFVKLAGAIMGRRIVAENEDEKRLIRNTLDEILQFYHVKMRDFPKEMDDLDEELEYLFSPAGIMRRTVYLKDDWYHQAVGPFLGFKKTGETVAFMPAGRRGYTWYDYRTGKKVRIDKNNAGMFKKEAICFYRSFPLRRMDIKDLFLYMYQSLTGNDICETVAVCALAVGLSFGSLLVTETLFWETVSPNPGIKIPYMISLLVGFSLSSIIFRTIDRYLLENAKTRMGSSVQAAIMMRMLSLPTEFFRRYSSGELASRAQYVNRLKDAVADIFLSAVPTLFFSLFFVLYVFQFAPVLGWLVLLEVLVTILIGAGCIRVRRKSTASAMVASSASNGMNFALISGIQKIKLSGAEKRAFAKWADTYEKSVDQTYNSPAAVKLNPIVPTVIPLFFSVPYYYFAAGLEIGTGNFFVFSLVYGSISAALMNLSRQMMKLADAEAAYELARPIFEAVPEISAQKKMVTKLSGRIEINHVSFRYGKDMPLLLNDLSIKIDPGQYVAIVGKSGCGKSTLMRLLLGFEKPEKGAVYYDGNDLSKIDLKSLRRKIGTVMQNGKLFLGDIYYNIIISAPWLTLKDAWDAAETAGIADDIRRMPMGMNTMISEDQNGISGGQRQRIVIARAIAPKPKILLLDEATSALDNVTQKKVSDALNSQHCTRIVIAHRLSTIKKCDRILVLDGGKIREDGTYEELLKKGGLFSELVARQRLDQVPEQIPGEEKEIS